jgi:hypothetical protein
MLNQSNLVMGFSSPLQSLCCLELSLFDRAMPIDSIPNIIILGRQVVHNFPKYAITQSIVGVLDTGVSWSTCSWAPSMAQLRPRGGTTAEASGEDPHEEAPHEENDDQNC